MPNISIIVPVYNVEKYLVKCLDSLLLQTYSDFEVILVDDGSPDNSGKICDLYAKKDSRIRVIHQKNSGPGPARNVGIQVASGKYITFTDADDWVAPQMLEKAVYYLENKEFDFVMYGNEAITYNESETKVVKTEIWAPQKQEYHSAEACRDAFCNILFSTSFNTPWNKLYKTSIVKEHGIVFPKLKRAQDAIFNMEYYKHIRSFCIIPDVLYYFRQNTNNKIWSKFPKDLYMIDAYYDQFIVEMLSSWGKFEGENCEQINRLCINSAFKTMGFYRNPKWEFTKEEKIAYIQEILNQDYLQKRVSTIRFDNPAMESKRQLILTKDVQGIMKRIQWDERRNRFYESQFYKVMSRIKHLCIN